MSQIWSWWAEEWRWSWGETQRGRGGWPWCWCGTGSSSSWRWAVSPSWPRKIGSGGWGTWGRQISDGSGEESPPQVWCCYHTEHRQYLAAIQPLSFLTVLFCVLRTSIIVCQESQLEVSSSSHGHVEEHQNWGDKCITLALCPCQLQSHTYHGEENCFGEVWLVLHVGLVGGEACWARIGKHYQGEGWKQHNCSSLSPDPAKANIIRENARSGGDHAEVAQK